MDPGPAPSARPGLAAPSMRIRPAFGLWRGVAGALQTASPLAGRADAVDAGRAGDGRRLGRIEHHHRLAAIAGLIGRLPQQPAIGADRLVRRAEMLARAILDRAHRLAGPLVVHIDVGAHAGIGRVLLLARIEAVIVAPVLARHVVRQFIELEPLAAHLVLVYG